MYQCYYQSDKEDAKTRCLNKQEDCWCCDEHRIAWQKENYIDNRQRGLKQRPIAEIQSRLKEMSLRKGQQKLNI